MFCCIFGAKNHMNMSKEDYIAKFNELRNSYLVIQTYDEKKFVALKELIEMASSMGENSDYIKEVKLFVYDFIRNIISDNNIYLWKYPIELINNKSLKNDYNDLCQILIEKYAEYEAKFDELHDYSSYWYMLRTCQYICQSLKNNKDKIKPILQNLERDFERIAGKDFENSLRQHCLLIEIAKLYSKYSISVSQTLSTKITNANKLSSANIHSLKIPIEIPTNVIDECLNIEQQAMKCPEDFFTTISKYVIAIFSYNTNGDANVLDCMHNISFMRGTPLSHDTNSQSIFKTTMVNLFFAIYIEKMLDYGKKSNYLTTENAMKYIYDNSDININRKDIIARGLNAFLDEDYITSCHLLTTQIEAIARDKYESIYGHSIIQKENSTKYLSLDSILSKLGEDKHYPEETILCLKSILTEQTAFNIRNNICHGIYASDQFTDFICNMLFCALLIIAKM